MSILLFAEQRAADDHDQHDREQHHDDEAQDVEQHRVIHRHSSAALDWDGSTRPQACLVIAVASRINTSPGPSSGKEPSGQMMLSVVTVGSCWRTVHGP